jgi:hypothetical protein
MDTNIHHVVKLEGSGIEEHELEIVGKYYVRTITITQEDGHEYKITMFSDKEEDLRIK